MAMTDQDLREVADIQVARGLARWIKEPCSKCGTTPIIHDYYASEDWCAVCGHSKQWSDEP